MKLNPKSEIRMTKEFQNNQMTNDFGSVVEPLVVASSFLS